MAVVEGDQCLVLLEVSNLSVAELEDTREGLLVFRVLLLGQLTKELSGREHRKLCADLLLLPPQVKRVNPLPKMLKILVPGYDWELLPTGLLHLDIAVVFEKRGLCAKSTRPDYTIDGKALHQVILQQGGRQPIASLCPSGEVISRLPGLGLLAFEGRAFI